MAVTCSTVMNGGGAPSGGNNVTASWTPDGTSQYLLTVSAYVSTGSAVPVISGVSGNGLTWTSVANANGDNTGTDRSSQYLFAVPSGGSAGTITISWSTSPTRASWVLDGIAGADSGLGSATLPQAAVTGTSSGANPSATLGSALQSGSVSYAGAAFESSAGTLGAGSGYTALGQNKAQSLAWAFTEWNSAGSTTASAANTTTSNRHSIILIEIAAASSGTNWTQTPTDDTGLTDAPSLSLARAQSPADGEGLSDTGTAIGHAETGVEPLGLTDSASVNLISGSNWTQTPADVEGLSDSVTFDLAQNVPVDTASLADALALNIAATSADTEGLTDTVNLGQAKAPTDSEGLSDSVAFTAGPAYADGEGLTDSITQIHGYGQTPADQLGLTDSVQTSVSSAGSLTATDATGATDSTSFAQGHAYTDSEGLTDTALIEKAQVVSLAEPENLTDSLTFGRILGPADNQNLTDTANLAAGYAQQSLEVAGLSDSAQVAVTGAGSVSASDPEGITDSTVVDQGHVYIDTGTLSDSVSFASAATKADAADLTDAVTLLLQSVRVIVDNAALSDLATVAILLPPTFGTATGAPGSAPSASPASTPSPGSGSAIFTTATAGAASMGVPTATGG